MGLLDDVLGPLVREVTWPTGHDRGGRTSRRTRDWGAGLLGQTPAWHWNQNAVIRNTSGFAREEMRS